MAICWFNNIRDEGVANFYSTNLTLNAIHNEHFESVEFVQVGYEEGKIFLRPVGPDELGRGLIDKSTLYSIVTHKSYSRISSTPLMEKIAKSMNLTFGKTPCKFKTKYDKVNDYLIIDMKEKID